MIEITVGRSDLGRQPQMRPHWCSLTCGEGRELHPSPPSLTMLSDTADVGYRGTLGAEQVAGPPVSRVGQGFWRPEDRKESITLRELSVMRNLHSLFTEYVSRPDVTKILLHEDNQAVVFIVSDDE